MSTPAYVLAAWDFEPTREEGCAFAIYPETTSEPLAYVVKREGAEEIARRIAAMPDLLAALIEMEREKSDYMRRNKLGDPSKEHTNKMARAAIAKATGAAS